MKIGFIGGGALTKSILKGLNFTGGMSDKKIYVSDHKQKRCDELTEKYGVKATVAMDSFIDKVNVLIIAVKPKDVKEAMIEISNKITNSDTIIMSVVAGLRISEIETYFPKHIIIRAMPNVAAAVGETAVAIALNDKATSAATDIIKNFWSELGSCVKVKENLMDAVTGLSGSGSAYAFLMIDALADGGVAVGLPREKSIELAAQTLLGAAKMVLETGKHPDVLRDKVTSPAGTTIEGVRTLEKYGIRSALIEAVIAATNKSKSL